MNKKFRIIAVIAVLLAVISFAGASFAWLSGANDIDVAIESSVLVQYFESGKGTKEEPFIIHTPRHLYNLAWLQYLGQFNGTKDDNIEITQYYFELCDGTSAVGHQGIEDGVLDMSSWVLPPIGTPEHPFVGHFEGNGITIANLTVSGNYDDLSDAADTKANFDKCAYDSDTNEGCDIVGLFGVVGSVTDEAGKIGTKTYNTVVNSVSNVDIDNITVKTETDTSLIGIIAGYVNGKIEGVGVANSNIDVAEGVGVLDASEFTDAISDYTTIGFCEDAYQEDAYIGKIDITEAKASESELWLRTMSSEEEGTQWGGSIAMNDLYDRMDKMEDNGKAIEITYYETEKQIILEDGSIITEFSDPKTYKAGTNFKNYSSEKGGSATFYMIQPDYVRFLYSGKQVVKYDKTIIQYSREATESDAYYISDSNTHYLTVDGIDDPESMGNVCDVIRTGAAVFSNRWSFVDDNGSTKGVVKTERPGEYDYVIDEKTGEVKEVPVYDVTYPAGYLRAQIGGKKYYLRHEGTSLVADTDKTKADIWRSDNGLISTEINGVRNYLNIENNIWKLVVQTQSGDKVITDGNGNYLHSEKVKSTYQVRNTTDRSNANAWSITPRGNKGYSYITMSPNGGNKYYLNIKNGSLVLSQSNSYSDNTAWVCTYDKSDATKYVIYNEDSKKCITYDSSKSMPWTLGDPKYSEEDVYVIKAVNNGTTYYLTANQTDIGNTTIKSSATDFLYDTTTNYISTTINGQTYYLTRSDTKKLGVSTTASTKWMKDNNNNWYVKGASSYYICYTNGFYLTTNTNRTRATMEKNQRIIKPVVYYVYRDAVDPAKLVFTEQDEEMEVDTEITRTKETLPVYTPYTYFPIIAENNLSTGYPAKDKNTGYFISGTKETKYDNGDIRVAAYDMYNLRNSLAGISSGGSYSNTLGLQVLTRTKDYSDFKLVLDDYNAGKPISSALSGYEQKTATALGLKKYSASREQLEKMLLESGKSIYGLHFMDAQISTKNIITADYAKINGTEYSNYELPEDAIDCNLAYKGFINFYAGTYFTAQGTNNSFFSLHEINRDSENKITDIKQIAAIYEDPTDGSKDYVYGYTGGGYSSGSILPSGYELVFDMKWIEEPYDAGTTKGKDLLYSMFYYEIPVNKGEYALGSVSGRYGAYLVYLDISTNAEFSKLERLTEWSEVSANTYEYPKGVQVISDASASEIGTTRTIFDTDSAAVKIAAGDSGVLNISRTGDAITVAASGMGRTTATFKGVKVTLVDELGKELNVSAIHSKDVKTKRYTEKTFNLTTNKDTKEVITTTATTIDDGATVYRTTYAKDDGEEIEIEPVTEEIVVEGSLIRYAYLTPSDAQVTNTIISGDHITKDCEYFPEMGTNWHQITDKAALIDCLSPYAVTINTDTPLTVYMKMLSEGYGATVNSQEFVPGGTIEITPSN